MNSNNIKKIRVSVITKIFFVFIVLLTHYSCKKNKEIKSIENIPIISVNEIKNTKKPLKLQTHSEQQDSVPEETQTTYFDKGMFYYYLNRKEEYPYQLSKNISKAVKFTDFEIKKYKLRSGIKASNFSFYKVNQQFLKESYGKIKFLLYYKTDHNKSASKILRIFHNNSTYDLILASKFIKGNGIYILDSKFESKSKFYQRIQFFDNIKVNKYTDIDSFNFEESDMIIKNYTYDDSIFFHKTTIDTIKFFSSFIIGKTFKVNGMNCFWKYNLTETNEYRMQLINAENNNIILYSGALLMYGGKENISLDDTKPNDFIDLNFDGYTDYKEYRHGLSGNGGMLYISYIYNPKTHFFEDSDVLSGSNLRVDTLNKCLVSSGRAGGGGPFYKTQTYFDDKGKIKYIENITNEILDKISNDSIKLIRTYKKTVKGKIIESRIDTIIKGSIYF